MFFNILIFLIIIILCIISKGHSNVTSEKKQLYFLRLVFFVFFVFVAFRGFNIGNDTKMYLRVFSECCSKKLKAIEFGGYYEVGYLILNVIIGIISNSKRFFMIVMSGILNYGAYKFIKENNF